MGTNLRILPALTVFGLIALAGSNCGATPQEGRTPRPRSRPSLSGPSTLSPSTESRGVFQGSVEGRTPRPRPIRSMNDSRNGLRRVSFYTGTRIIIPPAWERCRVLPTFAYWQERDLMAEIQWISRRGFIPVTPLGDAVESISDFTQKPAGWRAYGISVPAGGTMQVEVKHGKLGWFRLMLVNKWGEPGAGMLQAAMAYQPVMVTYKNPGKEATAVYVIVDDPAWWSDAQDPYTLEVRRDWDPAKTDLSQVKMVAGLWGSSPSVSAEFAGPSMRGPADFRH